MRGGLLLLLLLPLVLACPLPGEVACGTTYANATCDVQGEQCPAGELCYEDACVPCQDQGVNPGEVACGFSVLIRLCDGALKEVHGAQCPSFMTCQSGECVAQEAEIVFTDPTTDEVVAGQVARIQAALLPPGGNVVYELTGWFEAASGTGRFDRRTTRADVGSREVEVSALVVDGLETREPAPPVTTVIRVLCDPDDPTHGACCIAGTTRYKDRGAACPINNDSNAGSCTQDGVCERVCTPSVEQRCDGDAITWYDSCGAPGGLVTNCAASGKTCVQGADGPRCDVRVACTGSYAYECRGQDGVRVDASCGRAVTVTTCSDAYACEATAAGVDCRRRGPCDAQPGTALCDGACVDLRSARTDCGACGSACAKNEQCVAGACTPLSGCAVVCDANEDCGAFEVCIDPGDCSSSTCRPASEIAPSQGLGGSAPGLLAAEPVAARFHFYDRELRVEVIPLAASVTGASVTLRLDETFAPSLEALEYEGSHVIDGRRVTFLLGRLDDVERVAVKARRLLGQHDAEAVTIERVAGTPGADLLPVPVALGLNGQLLGGHTRVLLSASPGQHVEQARLVVRVPECFPVDETDGVLVDARTVVFSGAALAAPAEHWLVAHRPVEESCWRATEAVMLAERLGRPVSPWWWLLVIPVFGSLLVLYQRLLPHEHGRLSWHEFRRLGQMQGLDKEKISEDWHDYKRRF